MGKAIYITKEEGPRSNIEGKRSHQRGEKGGISMNVEKREKV